jgi:hemerythrin-like domain-containing protein
MKRHPALHSLSHEHHQALVLALRIGKAAGKSEGKPEEVAALLASVPPFFHAHLEPHFQIEERDLFPALSTAGHTALVARTAAEHREMRALLEGIEMGDAEALTAFGALLKAHVQFEEKELFGAYEGTLG